MNGVDGAWSRQRRWSRLADQLQRNVRRARGVNLALLVVGALAGAFAAQDWMLRGGRVVMGAVAAVALAVAAVVQQRYLAPEAVGRWPLARAASEAIKAEVYRYLVSPDVAREIALRDDIKVIESKANDLRADLEVISVTAAPLPALRTVADYVETRAKDQRRWHQDRASAHLAKAKRLHKAEVATTLVATVLAAVAGVLDSTELSAWVAAATTVAAAVAAHVLAAEHARVARSYLSTSDQLQELIHEYERDPASVERTFVEDVERVLLAQNEGWGALVRPR